MVKIVRLVILLVSGPKNQDGVLLTVAQLILDVALGVAIGDLLIFHLWLRSKGLTTYDHILAKRETKLKKASQA